MSGLFFPALICGILCYLGAIECANPLGTTGSFYCLGRPLVAGLLLGLAFGDVTQGVLCGVAVQTVFIANLSTGGATNSEIAYASYGGIGLATVASALPWPRPRIRLSPSPCPCSSATPSALSSTT